MTWNRGMELFDEYTKRYNTCKSGCIGVKKDLQSLKTFVTDLLNNGEDKQQLLSILVASGSSQAILMQKIAPLQAVLIILEEQFPDD